MQGIDCHGVPPYLINPVEALKDYAATVHYTEGCGILKNDTGGLADAAADASKSDAAVMVLGLDPSVEYEMRDRTDLLLPGEQAGLVAAVRKALGPTKPLVLVLMGGGVIDTAPVDDLVDAILWVGYPGQVRKTASFLEFPYVCPEPVLAKCSFLYINGSKMPFSAQSGGTALAQVLYGRETPLFAPLIYIMHHFTKTGSGQT
jgi:hypothetical protein